MDGLAVVIVKCRGSGLEGRRFGAALSFLVECPGFVGQAVFNRAVSVVDGAYFRNVPAGVVADERLDSFLWAFALWQVFRSYKKSLCQIKISFHLFTKSSKVSPVQRMAGLVLGQAQLCRCPNMFVVSECFFKYCA